MVKQQNTKQKRTLASLRGLASAGDHGVRRVDGYRADPRVIEIEEGFNIRASGDPDLRAHIDSIKDSIRAYITRDDPECRVSAGGLREVIPDIDVVVRADGAIVVTDGHCRMTAIRELIAEGFDIKELDINALNIDEADRVVVAVRSSLGKDLTPIDKAIGFERLHTHFGWSFPDISRKLGGSVTAQRVEQLVLLGRAPEELRAMVVAKQITADSAIEIIRKHRDDPQEAVRVVTALVEQRGTRPVGKGQTRVAIPQKVQDGLFVALRENKGLDKTLKEMSDKEGWEDEPIPVMLPAGVVKAMLDREKKSKAAPGEAAKDGSE